MRFLMLLFFAPVLALGISCNDNKDQRVNDLGTGKENFEDLPDRSDTISRPLSDGSANTSGVRSSPQNTGWDKKIIKKGTLTIETDNYRKYNTGIRELLKSWEAYVANEEESSSLYKIENVMTIKIPVQYFDNAIQQLSSTDKDKLLVKQVNALDVTAEYFDTRARIETKRTIRLRYLEMVKKAKNMEEVLQVEREINALQEQIDAGEGKMRYLGHSAVYSTIQLTFFQVLKENEKDAASPAFLTRMFDATSGGLQWFGELVIFVLRLWPIWMLGGLTYYFVRSKRK